MMTCTNADCPLALRRERLPSRRSITGEPPSVFSLGLVWNNWGPALLADLLEMLSRVVNLDVIFCKPSNKRGGCGVPGMVWPLEEDVSFGKVKGVTARCFRYEKAERLTHAHACVALVLLCLYFCYDRICDAFFIVQSATIDDPPEH